MMAFIVGLLNEVGHGDMRSGHGKMTKATTTKVRTRMLVSHRKHHGAA